MLTRRSVLPNIDLATGSFIRSTEQQKSSSSSNGKERLADGGQLILLPGRTTRSGASTDGGKFTADLPRELLLTTAKSGGAKSCGLPGVSLSGELPPRSHEIFC